MALLVLATVVCNLGAMYNLYDMHRRQRHYPHRCSRDRAQSGSDYRHGSLHPLEELDHFVLLALMTVLFTMCSLPLIYRAYYGAFKLENKAEGDSEDLQALRFLSVISIVDPWIFIIFRTSVFRMLFHKVFTRPLIYRNWSSHSQQSNVESTL